MFSINCSAILVVILFQERDEMIGKLHLQVKRLQTQPVYQQTPEEKRKVVNLLKSELVEAKEAVDLQNERIEEMQMNLQMKDDQIEALEEAIETRKENVIVYFMFNFCFVFSFCLCVYTCFFIAASLGGV